VPAPPVEQAPAPAPPPADGAAERAAAVWSTEIVPSLKPFVRSIYSVPRVLGVRQGALTLGAPNDAHRSKCEQHRAEVEAAAARVAGGPVPISLVVESGGAGHDDHDDPAATSGSARVVTLHPAGPPPADDEVDLHDLTDAPPDTVVSPIDRLAQAFPGSELIDERR
jgi:DNA polymerase-3 subunit gamma/tau